MRSPIDLGEERFLLHLNRQMNMSRLRDVETALRAYPLYILLSLFLFPFLLSGSHSTRESDTTIGIFRFRCLLFYFPGHGMSKACVIVKTRAFLHKVDSCCTSYT